MGAFVSGTLVAIRLETAPDDGTIYPNGAEEVPPVVASHATRTTARDIRTAQRRFTGSPFDSRAGARRG